MVGFETDLRGSGHFLGPRERNIHRVEEDRIHRHLLVGAGEIQGQPDSSLLVESSRLVIVRPGPLAVFLALRLNLQSIQSFQNKQNPIK